MRNFIVTIQRKNYQPTRIMVEARTKDQAIADVLSTISSVLGRPESDFTIVRVQDENGRVL